MIRAPLLLQLSVACAPEQHGRHRPEPPVWSEVAPIVGERCGSCHHQGGIAGLPLTTWREVSAARDVVGYAVEQRLMPPWPAVEADYPLQSDPSLTDGERSLIAAWVEADAPLGDADPDEPVPPPPIRPGLPQVDAVLSSPVPYQPASELADDHRCFILEPSTPIEGYVRGYQFAIDNRSVIHHAKLMAVYPTDGGATLAEQLALDPEPGFTCLDQVAPAFGGPLTLVGTWLPGSDVVRVYPEGAGLAVRPEAVFVLVVHYHPPGSDGLPDRTGVELWLEPTVDRVVDVTFFTHHLWTLAPAQGGLLVPAGDAEVEHHWSSGVRMLGARSFDVESTGVDVLSAVFHMHRIGARGQLVLEIDGEERTLLDIPRWDVDWQLEYWPVEPIHLGPEDRISVRCVHDNGDGTEDVTWGEGTDDEMCGTMLNIQEPDAG